MNDIELLDVDTGADFFAPVSTDAISGMVAQYQAMRGRIEQIASVVTGEMAVAMRYFLDGNADSNSRWAAPSVERLFQSGGAVAALNAAYWSKALALTDVLDLMPQKRRDEWNKSIMDRTTPDFTEDTVRNTLDDLINMRAKFFAERVDGIFRGLSGEHVTNAPQGFGKRMIIARVLNEYGHVEHSRTGLINDLRAVIAKFMGRDEPLYSATDPLIYALKGRWGEWVDVDGGALRIRLYKKGTAHLEVHPDMAWRLNQILASLYPLAIPPEFRAKPKRRVREFDLIRKPLPFQVVGALASMEEATKTLPQSERRDWRDNGLRTIPKTRAFRYTASKDAIPEAERVLEAIGGVKQPGGYFLFDYEPGEVLSEIVVSGCIPDHRSHQFYPTPLRLAERLVELAGIEPHHTVLEPSAGIGGLADLLPKDMTRCVEVSELHAKVLEAKGHHVTQADFLQWPGFGLYDRIVMNPPFSEGRWHAHVEHAASMLARGGRLVAILPSGAKNRDGLLSGISKEWHGPFDGEFAGTSVSVVMLVANR